MLTPRSPIFLIDPQELLFFPQIRDKEWTLPVLIPKTAIYIEITDLTTDIIYTAHHTYWQNSYRKKYVLKI